MQHLLRTRTGSVSDIHIAQCDCDTCDGLGQIFGDQSGLWGLMAECPTCEGMGYMEISGEAEQAYQAYLSDLYQEVVHEIPGKERATAKRQSAAA